MGELNAVREQAARALSLDPDDVRASLLNIILRVTAVLGGLVYLPSVGLAARLRLFGIVGLDTVALLLVVGLLVFKRLPFRHRAWAVCLVFYSVAIGLLLWAGSISLVYLLAFSVLVVLLLGLRPGLYSVLLSSASLMVLGGLGFASTEMQSHPGARNLWGWAVVSLNFALVDALITAGVGSVFNALNSALQREISTRSFLHRDRNTLRTLIDALPDVVFTKDRAERFVICNQATVTLLGQSSDSGVVGKTVYDFYASREVAEAYHQDDLSVLAGRKVLNREERTLDSAGRPVWLLTHKLPLFDSAGEVTGLIGVSRNITSLKEAENERFRLQAATENNRRELEAERSKSEAELLASDARQRVAEESNRAKSAFLAMMSHELRTPLNAIIGFSEVLLNGKCGPTNELQSRYLKSVLSSGLYLLSLINSLLDLSKIEAGKLHVTRQPCSLRALALETLVTVEPLANAKEILLLLEPEPPDPAPIVLGDPLRCKQVFYNFLSNSIKFTPKGGRVTVSCEVAGRGTRVRASIADTGPGIQAADLGRLFKPFEQLEQSGLKALAGTGLGLSLNRQPVELMGGEVGVESSPGKGSVFFFELQVANAEPRAT